MRARARACAASHAGDSEYVYYAEVAFLVFIMVLGAFMRPRRFEVYSDRLVIVRGCGSKVRAACGAPICTGRALTCAALRRSFRSRAS